MGGGLQQGYGMNQNMTPMPGMPSSMSAQGNNMSGGMGGGMTRPHDQQRAYQMRLLQQQQQMRTNGMMGQRPGQMNAMYAQQGQQSGAQMPNGQQSGQMSGNPSTLQQQQQQQQHAKRQQFLQYVMRQFQSQGKQFNPNPAVGGRPLDLYALWIVVSSAGGSQNVDRNGQWQAVANKLGYSQHPTAAQEIKHIYASNVSAYEAMYMNMRTKQKQEQARMHAHQMAGFSGPTQGSPQPRMMQPPQTNQYQQQQFQQGQQPEAAAPPPPPPVMNTQTTPVPNSAQLPQNGMVTPQQMMGPQAQLQHRRESSVGSVRKSEQTPQQPGSQPVAAPSPQVKTQRQPSVKQEASGGMVMKSEEPQSTNYIPQMRTIEFDGGYDIPALYDLCSSISRATPVMPTVDEMGVIDTRAITLSLASGIHGEVRYALDALAVVSMDQRISFELDKCEDLMDTLVDCAEDQTELLSDEAAEVSDALDLSSYEDVMRGSRVEADTLQDVPQFGTREYDLDRAADKLIAITTILRNFSFFEHNHRLLTAAPLIKWLSNTIRLLGTRNMLLRTHLNTQDFYKDVITLLSNITQSLELPSRDDALHILHFLLAFAPQPAPSYADGNGNIRFTSFVPAVHRYLPPAVDCLAKLLARQEPNRVLYRSIFTASSSSLAVSESPLDLLTRAFALAISVLPDRTKGSSGNNAQLRIVEARKAYLTQGMLAADILSTLTPSNNAELARTWVESEDGWAVSLLNLASLLSVDRPQPPPPPKQRDLGMDTESFKLITHRALTMMKRLAEKAVSVPHEKQTNGASKNGGEDGASEKEKNAPAPLRFDGIPQGHAILGATLLGTTDKVALGLLCKLHDLAMSKG